MPDALAQTATLHILYFAWLRERIGVAEERLALPQGVATVGELKAHLRRRSDGHAVALAMPSVRCAVNQEFAGPDDAVHPGDEVAFFPPVTGG